MTGFGKSLSENSQNKIGVEIKSLNSKSIDLNIRIPSAYREKELEIRKIVAEKLQRGKIDLSISLENLSEKTTAQINALAVRSYIEQLKKLTSDATETQLLKMAVRMPDALVTPNEEVSVEEYQLLLEALNQAIEKLICFREQEGKALKKDFEFRIENLKNFLQKVQEIDPERLNGIRERLQKSVAEIREKVDENRFEQELIFYLEKMDITEEKVRLKNHLEYFIQTLNEPYSNGRKLGFICQEIGREINTMGSKANFAPMQQIVVQMKDELEKIKEQILNVL